MAMSDSAWFDASTRKRTTALTLAFALGACAPHREVPVVEAHELVVLELVGRPHGMSAYSCPWFPESAEFINLSSHPIRIRAVEVPLRQSGKHGPAPVVPQTIDVDVSLQPYGRERVLFREPTPDGRGSQASVRLQGCKLEGQPRISEAEFDPQ